MEDSLLCFNWYEVNSWLQSDLQYALIGLAALIGWMTLLWKVVRPWKPGNLTVLWRELRLPALLLAPHFFVEIQRLIWWAVCGAR